MPSISKSNNPRLWRHTRWRYNEDGSLGSPDFSNAALSNRNYIAYQTQRRPYLRDLPCTHRNEVQGWGAVVGGSDSKGSWLQTYENMPFSFPLLPWSNKYVNAAYRKVYERATRLSFQKNNNFNVFVAITELDETIAAFFDPGILFRTYGGQTWGLKPLLSDVKSILDSYDDIANGKIEKSLRRRSIKNTASFWYQTTGSRGRFTRYEGNVGLIGRLAFDTSAYSPSSAALRIFLDELGAHPDLNTVWDAIPLSFVVDYYLPVGQALMSLHPSGWFKPKILFTGTRYMKYTATHLTAKPDATYLNGSPHPRGYVSSTPARTKVYQRDVLASLPEPLPISLEWEAPNAMQIFNTAYIALAGKSPITF